jgi:hypothetical protein
VKGTDILHSGKIYPEGSSIELSDIQAKQLADFLEPIAGETKTITKAVKPEPAPATTQVNKTASSPNRRNKEVKEVKNDSKALPAETPEIKTAEENTAKIPAVKDISQNSLPTNMRSA